LILSPLQLSIMPSLIPAVGARSLSHGSEFVRGAVGSLTWGPALALAKPAILSIFARIEKGTLLLVDEPAETRHVFGQKLGTKFSDDAVNGVHVSRRADAIPRVELVVKSDAFWMRLFLFADMGFSEAYMLGEVECEDLTAFFQVIHFVSSVQIARNLI
jgi:cyclopropane-fatty-acyl-phospholipid synthase